ncbi:hypothetical protein [Brevundimonas sp. Marseille-Q4549]
MREDALHLLYFVWMHWADPSFVTGMDYDPDIDELWSAIFEYFGGEQSQDAEFLHVAALMGGLFPFCLGDEVEWTARAERMEARSIELQPEGFSPEHFDRRGEYGEYFAHHERARRERLTGGDGRAISLRSRIVEAAQRFFGLGRSTSP